MDCPYVWNAHAPAARQAGVSEALIEALRETSRKYKRPFHLCPPAVRRRRQLLLARP
jgi:hypothetical protein